MVPDAISESQAAKPDSAFDRYCRAVQRTHELIDLHPVRSATQQAAQERAEQRMARLSTLLDALDNPHRGAPLIHVAGTSGKGSTATAIAAGLTAAGYRTALHTSPYLQSATEKLQIDGRLIDGNAFADLVESSISRASEFPVFQESPVSYGELWMAMALRWITHSGADVGVVETGAGGRFDLSNVISPLISVITTIGLDHIESLGPTIADIAWHKAGIIKPGAPVVTGVRDPGALEVIVKEAASTGSRLVLPDWQDRQAGSVGGDHGVAIPPYHRDNQALAAATLRELNPLGFALSREAIGRGVAGVRLPGRAEIMQRDPIVLLDGAHNPQKMASLAETLRTWLPLEPGRRRTIVFGSLEEKSYQQMIDHIAPLAGRLVLTSPHVFGKPGADPAAVAAGVTKAGFTGEIAVIPDVGEVVETAIRGSGSGDDVVVTGSMYLVGNARERWYSTREIVEQQTPWPNDHHLPPTIRR